MIIDLTTLREYVAKDWQDVAFNTGKDANYFFMDAPGGGGKSLVQAALAAYDMKTDGRRKQLICVPQSHISESFLNKTIRIGNETLNWRVNKNLCSLNQKRVASLLAFLMCQQGGTAVCTHAGLARLWTRLTPAEKDQAICRLTLTLDEAHHLAGIVSDDDLSEYSAAEQADILDVCPKLSEIVRAMLGQPGCKIRLATATFFRGDQAVILSDDVRSQFVEYRLRWEDYFPQTGIDAINFAFQLYDPDPVLQIVDRISQEPRRRHLIILPKKGHRFCNALTAERLIGRLGTILNPNSVLDLVTEKTQRTNKRLLYRQPDQYHAVVSCCLFNEGTDWERCDVMHNADACERSATLAMQRFYRPLRRFPSKKQVDIINYLPRFAQEIPEPEKEKILNCRLNAVLMRLVLEGEVEPVRPVQNGKGRQPTLAEFYGRKVYQDILRLMVLQYEAIADKDDAGAVFQIVDDVIRRHGLPDGVDEAVIRFCLEKQLVRISRPLCPVTKLALGGVNPTLLAAGDFRAQFKAQGTHASASFFEAECIDSAVFRRMAENVARVPLHLTDDGIADGVRGFIERTGDRPHCKTAWIEELHITGRALDMRLRSRQSCLADVVAQVAGRPRQTTLVEIEQAIQAYHDRTGTWPISRTGEIPEIGLHSGTVQTRLRGMGTTLAKVVSRLKGAGPQVSA